MLAKYGIVINRTFAVTCSNLVQQTGKSHLFSIASNSSIERRHGFLSYASWNSEFSIATQFPIIEQRRYRKFMPKNRWNWRFKQPHSPEVRVHPQYKYDYRKLEGKEYTHVPFYMKWLDGVNPETGEKINYHVMEPKKYKLDWFWIDYKRNRFSPTGGGCYEERILEIRRAPNSTAYIALAAGSHGRRWILATENMEVGDVVRSYNYIPTSMLKGHDMPDGDSWPIGALPPGTKICNIQTKSTSDYVHTDYAMINAGTCAAILRQQGDFTVVAMHKTLELALDRNFTATIGRLSNVEHGKLSWGSMNMKRRVGIKQRSGVWQKKDGYCGRKFHPLRKLTVDENTAPPPEIRIPITLTTKDYNALFGNAASQPLIYRVSGYEEDK